jgi:hypothetical protein
MQESDMSTFRSVVALTLLLALTALVWASRETVPAHGKPRPGGKSPAEPPALDPANLALGQVGEFPRQDRVFYFEVQDVLGPKEMLVLGVRLDVGAVGSFGGAALTSVGEPFVVRGVSARPPVDEARVALTGTFAVMGLVKLEDGQTVFVVEPVAATGKATEALKP